MNFEKNKLSVDEIEINVKNIISRCVKNIKLIIICALIAAILLPGLKYISDMNDYGMSMKAPIGSDVDIELTEDDMNAIDEYLLLLSKKEELEDYRKNSLLMQLDVRNVYQAKIQLYVDANEKDGENIAQAIVNYVKSDVFELKETVAESDNYSHEMVAALNDSSIVFLRLWATSEEECRDDVKNLIGYIKDYSNSLQERLGTHVLKVIEEEYICTYVEEVFQEQKYFIDSYESISSDYSRCRDSLTDKQKMYISSLDENNTDFDSDLSNLKPTIDFKFVIVGGILGVIFGVVIIIAFMLFGGCVQSEEEIEKRLQIINFGTIKRNIKQNNVVFAKVQTILNNLQLKKIGLVSTNNTLEGEQVTALIKCLEEDNVKCSIIGNIMKDDMAVKSLTDYDAKVFIDQVGTTKIRDVYQEASICKDVKTEVVGYLMLEQ